MELNTDDVIEWVLKEQGAIRSLIRRFTGFEPDETDVGMQSAIIAALKAYRLHPDISSPLFVQTFCQQFEDDITQNDYLEEVTPCD